MAADTAQGDSQQRRQSFPHLLLRSLATLVLVAGQHQPARRPTRHTKTKQAAPSLASTRHHLSNPLCTHIKTAILQLLSTLCSWPPHDAHDALHLLRLHSAPSPQHQSSRLQPFICLCHVRLHQSNDASPSCWAARCHHPLASVVPAWETPWRAPRQGTRIVPSVWLCRPVAQDLACCAALVPFLCATCNHVAGPLRSASLAFSPNMLHSGSIPTLWTAARCA